MTVSLPTVNGPTDLPDLRQWLVDHWRPGTLIADVFPDAMWVHRTLKAAALWWVEHDTCEILAESAPTIPADLTLNMTDLPTPAGLAVFASNLEGIDADPAWNVLGGICRVSAVLWGPINIRIDGHGDVYNALSIATLSRSMLRDGTLKEDDVLRAYPTLAAIVGGIDRDAYQRMVDGGSTTSLRYPTSGDLFTYLGRSDWLPDTGPDKPLPGDDVPEQTLRSKAEDRRLVAALWALTRAKVSHVTPAKIARPAQRRSQRHGLDPTVRVLRLGGERITHTRPAGVSTRDWQHSWIVSPHFRWQVHGPGRTERKLILVEAYLKGDPNLPLLGAERVWRVVPPKDR